MLSVAGTMRITAWGSSPATFADGANACRARGLRNARIVKCDVPFARSSMGPVI